MISKTVYIFDLITENIYFKILSFAVTFYVLIELTTIGSFNIQSWLQEETAKTILIVMSLLAYSVTIVTRWIKSRREKEKHKIELGNLAIERESIEKRKRKDELDLRSAEFEKGIREEKLRKLRLENEQLQKKIEEDKNYGT